ncbi:hypothetical protein ERO13_D05G309850v2, partial [Gossypium hirsutum]
DPQPLFPQFIFPKSISFFPNAASPSSAAISPNPNNNAEKRKRKREIGETKKRKNRKQLIDLPFSSLSPKISPDLCN